MHNTNQMYHKEWYKYLMLKLTYKNGFLEEFVDYMWVGITTLFLFPQYKFRILFYQS